MCGVCKGGSRVNEVRNSTVICPNVSFFQEVSKVSVGWLDETCQEGLKDVTKTNKN